MQNGADPVWRRREYSENRNKVMSNKTLFSEDKYLFLCFKTVDYPFNLLNLLRRKNISSSRKRK